MSARDDLLALLNRYDMSSLIDWAWDLMIDGATADQVENALYERQEFKDRFEAIFIRQANGLPAVSAEEVLAYERDVTANMRLHGVPSGFYDEPSDFAQMMGANKSLQEIDSLLTDYETIVAAGRDELRGQLAQHLIDQGTLNAEEALMFADGVTDGEWVSFLLDPDRSVPAIRNRVQSAAVSAAGIQAGFGALTAGEADTLQASGVDEAAARQRLGDLAGSREITGTLAGETGGMSREDVLGVAAGNADSAAELERRRRRRQGAFEGGGGFATSGEGITGVGSS